MIRPALRLAALALGLALLGAACANGGEPTARRSPTPAAGDGEGGLRELASTFEGRDARIAYTMRNQSEGEAQEGEFELFWMVSENTWRMDFTLEEQGSSSLISTPDQMIVCSPAEESCFTVPGEQTAVPIPFIGDAFTNPEGFGDTIAQRLGGADLETSERVIAGRAASCFSGSNEGGSFQICFDDDGVLLFWRFENEGGTSTIEATEVGEVSSEDFEAPYPVQEFPQPGQ